MAGGLLLGEVEAVEVHDLRPGGDEVVDELRLAVGAGVDFREGTELRVGAEDEVHRGGGPLYLAGLAVRRMVSRGNRLPLLSTTHLVLSRVAGAVERAVLFGEPRLEARMIPLPVVRGFSLRLVDGLAVELIAEGRSPLRARSLSGWR